MNDTPSPAPSTGTPVTQCLLGLLIVIYLVTAWPDFERPSPTLLLNGVFDPELARHGQWWRLLTANFLHASWGHLLQNCLGLFILGRLLEPLIGSRWMLLLLLASGMLCMLFSYWLVLAPTLGASGMVFGVLGCYLALSLMVERRFDSAQFKQQLRGALLFCLIFMLSDTFQRVGVNAWGHLGGLTAGVLIGLWLSPRFTRRAA